MKLLPLACLTLLALPACGGPKEEDILTGDKIRASQSAPELPDVQLSENPEPPPAPPPPEPTLNEIDNAVDGNVIEAGVPGNIPPAFQGLWGVAPTDCRPGEVAGNAVLLTGDQIISANNVASLAGVLADSPARFDGRFAGTGGYESHEQFVLGGGGNLLTRTSGGQRIVYQRCIGASR